MKYRVVKGVSYLTPGNTKKKASGRPYDEERLNPGDVVSTTNLKGNVDALLEIGAITEHEAEDEEVDDAR